MLEYNKFHGRSSHGTYEEPRLNLAGTMKLETPLPPYAENDAISYWAALQLILLVHSDIHLPSLEFRRIQPYSGHSSSTQIFEVPVPFHLRCYSCDVGLAQALFRWTAFIVPCFFCIYSHCRRSTAPGLRGLVQHAD